MRQILLGLVLCWLLTACGSKPTQGPGLKNYILWKRTSKPAWADFQGTVPWVRSADASTHYVLGFIENDLRDSIEINLSTYFIKDSSWVIRGMNSPDLLNHEVRHFDLAEVYARKYRKYLSDWDGDDAILFSLYADYGRKVSKLDSAENEYDKETNHSLNHTEQEKWNRRIDSLLEAYSAFDKPIFRIALHKSGKRRKY
jgi:hypothetical protein